MQWPHTMRKQEAILDMRLLNSEMADGIRWSSMILPVSSKTLKLRLAREELFIAEPGMIVVPEVTLFRMQDAVLRLYQSGFFDSFVHEN